MPVRTIHCKLCREAISGYDFPERMRKLRSHRKEHHPEAFKKSIKRGIKTKEGNPGIGFPLIK